MASESARNYKKNKASRDKKNAYGRTYYKKNKATENASRAERKKFRETAERNGKSVKGKDVAHTKNGLRLKSSAANRGSKSDSPGDKRARGGKYKK
jgi:hypothetical protein